MTLRLLLATALSIAPVTGALAATPFPAGYDAAYRAYLASLPPPLRGAPWAAKLIGVASQPASMTIAGKPVIYLFSCKPHNCDTDQVNIFLAPDRRTARGVITSRGVRTLIGGAGPREVACVQKLNASGGTAQAC